MLTKKSRVASGFSRTMTVVKPRVASGFSRTMTVVETTSSVLEAKLVTA
jgi:hypothetical protein